MNSVTTHTAGRPSTTHRRSQLFNPKLGINRMVTAAQPLLALLRRIQHCPNDSLNPQALQSITYEMSIFEHRLRDQQYDARSIHMASMLASWSVLQVMKQKKQSTVPQLTADGDDIAESSNDTPEVAPKALSNVDPLLGELLSQPSLYLDVTELAYLCMADFNYDHSQDSLQALFDSIQSHRQPQVKPKGQTPAGYEAMATADTKRNKWPYKAIIMGGLILCLTTVISEVAIHYRTAQLLEASVAHATE